VEEREVHSTSIFRFSFETATQTATAPPRTAAIAATTTAPLNCSTTGGLVVAKGHSTPHQRDSRY